MKSNPTSTFDTIAASYYNSSVPAISKKYFTLLQKTFAIKPTDTILDLGCGAGDLTLKLADISSFVEGIDNSRTMIKMAKAKDVNKKVQWIYDSVENFEFGEKKYDLILSFESFHLFPKKRELIKKCAKALKKGGFLCIGFRMYAFDIPLREAFEQTFADHNIPYEWGFWTYPNFSTDVKAAKVGLSSLEEKDIKIPARVSTENILNFVFNISHSASLTDNLKRSAYEDLKKRILKVYPSGECRGYDQYIIQYCRK